MAAAVAAVVAVASCSGDVDAPATAGTASSRPASSDPTTAEPGKGATGAPAASGAASTPLGAPPAGAHPAVDGDVDGDGRPDVLSVSGTQLLVHYSGGGTDSVAFQAGDPTSARLLGASDADSDGHAEVFVQVDQGAAQQVSTLFRYVGGHLRLVTLDGKQATLAYGGSTGYVASWSCRPSSSPNAALATATGPSTGPNVYKLTVTNYQFDGTRLVTLSTRTLAPAGLDTLPIDHDAVSGKAGCGPVLLGQ
ncbi:FG-GAP repeat domain-containing protein [Pseudofrankia inefficax]|uniref:FG-GAP repeat domain-containing protein n=1 Tax=Pseudofrankia inefficax (strain DSM 45817 / CECT 9037 / DDB 130130 / EuI1c) TaxID=298654 RepID=UPI0034A563E9